MPMHFEHGSSSDSPERGDDVARIEYTNARGERAIGYKFDPTSRYERGLLALDSRVIDAAVLAIDPAKRAPDNLRVVIVHRWKDKPLVGTEPVYWLFPLDVARNWFVVDERVISDPQRSLDELTKLLIEQRAIAPDTP